MKLLVATGFALAFRLFSPTASLQAAPPFSGTIFIDPDIITSSDPTTFQGISYAGQGSRLMFDRRVNAFITVNAYLFNATFNDGLTSEIQVNPEFGSPSNASLQAEKYGTVIGRLPTVLRVDVDTVWIHAGIEGFGGGNNNLLIHTGQADLYSADGILEETFVHEAAHTSLDAAHAAAPGWLAAQIADGEFISTYARDFPTREDIAESFLPYLAIRYRADRINQSLANTITQTIPNRIAYFDRQSFDLYPIVPEPGTVTLLALSGVGILMLRRRNTGLPSLTRHRSSVVGPPSSDPQSPISHLLSSAPCAPSTLPAPRSDKLIKPLRTFRFRSSRAADCFLSNCLTKCGEDESCHHDGNPDDLRASLDGVRRPSHGSPTQEHGNDPDQIQPG
jgi:hypothetical protein